MTGVEMSQQKLSNLAPAKTSLSPEGSRDSLNGQWLQEVYIVHLQTLTYLIPGVNWQGESSLLY